MDYFIKPGHTRRVCMLADLLCNVDLWVVCMTDEKRPVGRPRTTLEDLPADWKDIIMQCGQDGQSAVTIRCKLGIGMSAWETLLEDYDEFRETVKEAKELCEHWWEERGRKMALGADGNATVWIFNMKNRFGWKDKSETALTGPNGSPLPAPVFNITGVAPKNEP